MLNGVRIIHGSSNKGGFQAYMQMRRLLKSDAFVTITPDGPRGPARLATASTIHLAASSGKPIIPFSYSAAPVKRSNSWDRLMIPKWFGRGVYAFGDPIYVTSKPSEAEVESARLALEDAINTVTARVDAAFNYQPDHIPIVMEKQNNDNDPTICGVMGDNLAIHSALLGWRISKGKERRDRLPERYGKASDRRPDGKLVWFHAASVGEAVSALSLARTLFDKQPDIHVLITSGTITSAQMITDAKANTPHTARLFIRCNHWMPRMSFGVFLITGDQISCYLWKAIYGQ